MVKETNWRNEMAPAATTQISGGRSISVYFPFLPVSHSFSVHLRLFICVSSSASLRLHGPNRTNNFGREWIILIKEEALNIRLEAFEKVSGRTVDLKNDRQ
jgi:hypothetical protein